MRNSSMQPLTFSPSPRCVQCVCTLQLVEVVVATGLENWWDSGLWRHSRLNALILSFSSLSSIDDDDEEKSGKASWAMWWGWHETAKRRVVGRVKSTRRRQLQVCSLYVRIVFGKRRVSRRKAAVFLVRKLKIKKFERSFSSVRHQICSSRGFRFKCKWKFFLCRFISLKFNFSVGEIFMIKLRARRGKVRSLSC